LAFEAHPTPTPPLGGPMSEQQKQPPMNPDRQLELIGQTPLHVGKVSPQKSCAHTQPTPGGPGMQVVPVGHMPSQAGYGPWAQGNTLHRHVLNLGMNVHA
jgi:hypothetical protein